MFPSQASQDHPDVAQRPKRKRRITRACDQCHRANTKCAPGPTPDTCRACYEFDCACTYDRPVLPRGPRKATSPVLARRSARRPTPDETTTAHDADVPWAYSQVASDDHIAELVELYQKIVYPIFPLFHWPSFRDRVKAQDYRHDQSFFATTMVICAIVAARLRNGALVHPASSSYPPSEVFAGAAFDALPARLSAVTQFEQLRAKALQAILYIQYGNVVDHRSHLGEYLVIASNLGFHDEMRWEQHLKEPQLQERRRTFWSMYTLEVYSTITWGGIIRLREAQCNVLYPAELDDETITDSGFSIDDLSHISFLRGWNFTTDMYRIAEHLLDRSRAVKSQYPGLESFTDIFEPRQVSPQVVLERVDALYTRLPAIFKSVRPMSGDDNDDRYGFQAVNIIVTVQTVKLVLAAAGDYNVEQRCAIAGELINALSTIPTSYIAAVSRPMLHHLASCGHLLGSVINRPLSQWALIQVRSVLATMSDLLAGLETSLHFAADISSGLRSRVTKIEELLAAAVNEAQRGQVFHSVMPSSTSPTNQSASFDIGRTDLVGFSRQKTHDPAHPAIHDSTLSTAFANSLPGAEPTIQLPQEHQTALQDALTAQWPMDFGAGLLELLMSETDWSDGIHQLNES